MRLAISPNLPQDDVTSNILAQTLEPGYGLKQPPLYEWMLWSVQRVTGPTLPSFLVLKYGLLTATFAFLYLVAKRIFADQRWTAVAALSPLLLYHIGWNLHEGVTQTIALICAVAASMWSFMRIAGGGRSVDYVLFGAIVGLGLLSKYSFAGFLVVLLGAALWQPMLRARLLDWRLLLSVGEAAVVTAPFVVWLIAGRHDLVALYGSAMAPLAETNRLKATLIGLGKAIYAPLAFLFPLDLIVLVLLPGVLREGWAAIKRAVSPRSCAGMAAASPAHHHGRLYRVDLWRAVDRRHALSRAVHASLLLAHAVVADRACGDERQPLATPRRACHGARRRHADRGAHQAARAHPRERPQLEGGGGLAQRVGQSAAPGDRERVRQNRGKRRRHARARGRPLAALSAGCGGAKVDLGDRGRGSETIRSPASKSVSWLSRRDEHWSTNPCRTQSLTDEPPISAQCKLILLHVIDLVILH
jgi:hypothetical protein